MPDADAACGVRVAAAGGAARRVVPWVRAIAYCIMYCISQKNKYHVLQHGNMVYIK